MEKFEDVEHIITRPYLVFPHFASGNHLNPSLSVLVIETKASRDREDSNLWNMGVVRDWAGFMDLKDGAKQWRFNYMGDDYGGYPRRDMCELGKELENFGFTRPEARRSRWESCKFGLSADELLKSFARVDVVVGLGDNTSPFIAPFSNAVVRNVVNDFYPGLSESPEVKEKIGLTEPNTVWLNEAEELYKDYQRRNSPGNGGLKQIRPT